MPPLPSAVHDALPRLRALAARWAGAGGAERANYQLYLLELCAALGVAGPAPATGEPDPASAYQFEFPVRGTARSGDATTTFADLYKAGAFVLEAKDAAREATGEATSRLLTRAFGQAVGYARDLPERPPYVLVLDVGATLLAWDRWSGTYGGYHAARRIDLRTLADRPDDVAFLRDVWEDPARRDPRRRAQAVTEAIAGLLGTLAADLERAGHAPERVARFLMRCVFTMFAEDVGLLPDHTFRRLLGALADAPAAAFVEAAEGLWAAMDAGGLFGYHRLLRFNGHFFREPDGAARALPLGAPERRLLLRAAEADWSEVEPSIFGTLLVRALTPEERHRLGAEYTPRAFIERLVRPTVEEPVRARWAAVQGEVLQLMEKPSAAKRKRAEAALLEFHAWLRGVRVLDPACGSGNFLYVTMHALKRVELEVFRQLSDVRGGQEGLRLAEVDPGQFFGIEVKPWAREIAELTLWIGFHQFWRQTHGDVQPDEPLLRDTGTLAQRDAVLAWDERVRRPERDRPDPTPRVRHPVTGKLVPDPAARLPYWEYVGARAAEWPEAEFIVGNPPYLGDKRMREVFGDGYADALRHVCCGVPDGADYVMHWWEKCARAVASGPTVRAGLITTNAITQKQNRAVIARASASGVEVVWTVPDHPWADGTDTAAVRVALTVLSKEKVTATRVTVDEAGEEASRRVVEKLNVDLTADADVAGAAATRLASNQALASGGFSPQASGFVLNAEEAGRLVLADTSNHLVVREYLGGRDLAQRSRRAWIIDFGLQSEAEARAFPLAYDIVRDRVKPDRDANGRAAYRTYWWRFGEPRAGMRAALATLDSCIVTVYVSRHRYFTMLPTKIAFDDTLITIASDKAWILGVLSSETHIRWALAAGSRLGVGNDPRYNKSLCFDPFPFPDPPNALRHQIAAVAEELDAHRKHALARDVRVTMTGMYNVVAKLRTGEPLTDKERAVHELAATGVLRDLHDTLDRLVAEAYGWPWPLPADEVLARLVALHDVRVAEEAAGVVRWLRPEYQRPRAGLAPADRPVELDLATVPAPERSLALATAPPAPWPSTAVDQIGALGRLIAARPVRAAEAAAAFAGAPVAVVERHLDTLALLGEARVDGEGRYAGAAAG